jgi:hypothetical protein
MQFHIDNKFIHDGSNPGLYQIDDFLNKQSIDESFDMSILNICTDFLEDGDLTLPEIITKLEQIKTQYQILLAQMNMQEENGEEEDDDLFI